jgi:hypothetical protein
MQRPRRVYFSTPRSRPRSRVRIESFSNTFAPVWSGQTGAFTEWSIPQRRLDARAGSMVSAAGREPEGDVGSRHTTRLNGLVPAAMMR